MPSPPVALNKLRVTRGATKVFSVSVKTSTGLPFSLVGFDIYMTVAGDQGPVIQKSIGNGIEVTCPSEGGVTVTLNSTDTSISPGCYKWDMVAVRSGTPDERYWIVGASDFTVLSSVTVF